MPNGSQMLLSFPKARKLKVYGGLKPQPSKQDRKEIDWDELERIAREDEAKPKLSFVQIGMPNPDYDKNYQHPKDGIPF